MTEAVTGRCPLCRTNNTYLYHESPDGLKICRECALLRRIRWLELEVDRLKIAAGETSPEGLLNETVGH